jgi:hypothetical protein
VVRAARALNHGPLNHGPLSGGLSGRLNHGPLSGGLSGRLNRPAPERTFRPPVVAGPPGAMMWRVPRNLTPPHPAVPEA